MLVLRRFTLCLFIMFFGMSCINTTYSRMDEQSISSDEIDLILGQFAHHSQAFYLSEVKRTEALLDTSPKNFDARNDLASALIKLKQYKRAESEFLKNEELHPNSYETAANLGVLYKKMKRYGVAAESIQRSLLIKPEGHMGLGDYYLRMIQWLGKSSNDPAISPVVNFLGIEYGVDPLIVAKHPRVKKSHLLTLIKNDYLFPDVYCVLGDVYFAEGNYQYALRCYTRANQLSQEIGNKVYVSRRTQLFSIWRKLKTDAHVLSTLQAFDQIDDELNAAKAWTDQFQRLESQRLQLGLPIDFITTKEALLATGVTKQKVLEAGFFKGEENDEPIDIGGYPSHESNILVWLISLVSLALAITIYLFKRHLNRIKNIQELLPK